MRDVCLVKDCNVVALDSGVGVTETGLKTVIGEVLLSVEDMLDCIILTVLSATRLKVVTEKGDGVLLSGVGAEAPTIPTFAG